MGKRPYRVDYTGQVFGRLSVIELAQPRQTSSGIGWLRYWRCRCECGNVVEVWQENLKGGKSESCGCMRREVSRQTMTTHGLSKRPEFTIWKDMHRRCRPNESGKYASWAGRGIKVCDRWSGPGGFPNFLADMGERPSLDHSLDRIDNDGDYEPGNVRWATRSEQNSNTRQNHLLTFEGRTQTLAAWARERGIAWVTLYQRLTRYGWTVERALTQPVPGD